MTKYLLMPLLGLGLMAGFGTQMVAMKQQESTGSNKTSNWLKNKWLKVGGAVVAAAGILVAVTAVASFKNNYGFLRDFERSYGNPPANCVEIYNAGRQDYINCLVKDIGVGIGGLLATGIGFLPWIFGKKQPKGEKKENNTK